MKMEELLDLMGEQYRMSDTLEDQLDVVVHSVLRDVGAESLDEQELEQVQAAAAMPKDRNKDEPSHN